MPLIALLAPKGHQHPLENLNTQLTWWFSVMRFRSFSSSGVCGTPAA